MSELTKLLKEFNIRMDDERERDSFDPEMGEEEDEFDFDFSGDGDDFDGEFDSSDDFESDFDQDDEFGDFERGEPEDEFGNDGLPSGLSDLDDEDGEFGGERKVDITDRLQKMLARRTGQDTESTDFSDEEFNLSDVDDFEGGSVRPRFKSSDEIGDASMDEFPDLENEYSDRRRERPEETPPRRRESRRGF